VGRHRAVDQVQEAAELLGAVARAHVGDDLTGGDVECRVEVRRPVADIVVGAALGDPRHERQDRRRAIERLDLGLLVDARHDGGLRRVEVEPDDVAHLVDELRVGRELEGLGLVPLQPERSPDALTAVWLILVA